MVRLIPLLDAKKLASRNRALHAALLDRHAKARTKAEAAERKLSKAYDYAFNSYLAPFADGFARIKHVALGELPLVDVVPEFQTIDIAMRDVAVSAVQSLAGLAGGSAAGAAAGGLTFAAVSAFATASTGAAIGGLSGAAATSATLAWLGGGAVAAGGGGVAAGATVLAGVVAAPAVLALYGVLWRQGEKSYNEQRQVHQELKQAEETLAAQILKSQAANRQVRRTAKVVRRLTEIGHARLPELQAIIDRSDDYRTFDKAEREDLAELVGLATTIAAVIACPLLDESGDVLARAEETLAAADALQKRMAA